jgi:hypothetical protein
MAELPGGGSEAALTRRFMADRPPFVCVGNAAVMLAPDARFGTFLTPEASWRALCVQALALGQAAIVAAPARGFLAGIRGPFSEGLIHGVSWHDFDGRSAQLMAEAE